MTKGYSMEIERKVYDDTEGVSVCVRPSPNNPDQCIEITTSHNASSMEYYGEIRLDIPKEQARLLGQALIAQCGETK